MCDQRGRWPGKYSGNTDPSSAHRSLGQVYSCLRVGRVGLVYLSIQLRGFSGKIEVVKVVRVSLSYLSCVGLLSLMHSFESEHNVWKSHARRDQFPCKHEVRRWWQGSDLSWWASEQEVAQVLAPQCIGRSWIVAKYCCGVTYSAPQCLWRREFLFP